MTTREIYLKLKEKHLPICPVANIFYAQFNMKPYILFIDFHNDEESINKMIEVENKPNFYRWCTEEESETFSKAIFLPFDISDKEIKNI